MFQVELDIFSGLPNPRWQLSAKEEKEMLDRVTADPSSLAPVSQVESKLGYRGFIVMATGDHANLLRSQGLPPVFRVKGGASTQPTDPSWLLNTSRVLDADLYDYVRDEQQSQGAAPPTSAAESGSTEADPGQPDGEEVTPDGSSYNCTSKYLTSSTNFDFWNLDPNHRANNNCYNYASNWRTNTFAQPGRQAGRMYTAFTCSNVGAAVIADLWRNTCATSNNLKIYLVIWPNRDFHFYRLCTNSRWCHKPGSTSATNRDNSGNYISNPATCDRGPYSNCSSGYYYATNHPTVR